KETIVNERISVVVFSDYDKGTLTDRLIQTITDFCYESNIQTILDPKRHTFFGLQNLTLVKPNERELKCTLLTQEQCSEEMGKTYLLNTLGKDGMKLYKNQELILSVPTFAEPHAVRDVTGCGDNVSAMIATC